MSVTGKYKTPQKTSISKCVLGCLCAVLSHISFAQNYSAINGHGIPSLTNAKAEWVDFNNDDRRDLFISGTTSVGVLNTAIYINNGNNTFNAIALTGLTDIAYDFADYDADGFIDILMTGINSSAVKKTILYRNNNGNAFVPQTTTLPALSKGAVLWEDLDRDSDIDLILSGLNTSGQEQTLLYKYENGGFVSVDHALPALSNGTLTFLNANNDAYPEVLFTGLNSTGSAIARIYTMHAGMAYSLYSENLPGFAFNSVCVGDYNEDGFTDIFMTGLSGGALQATTVVLQNNTVNDFTAVNTPFKNLSSSSIDVADLNNDGKTDIILSGIDDGGIKYFKYYQNSSLHTFSDISHSLPNIYNGDAALGDFDNDGDIDIFQIGNSDIAFQSNLYESDASSTPNAAPSAPVNLDAIVTGDSVYFSWDVSSDDHMVANSIAYNFYISRDANANDFVVSPLSNSGSGYRRLSSGGNAASNLFASRLALPAGKYYWSVQAIDNNFNGSSFSAEETFSVCDPISLGNDTTICKNDVLSLTIGSNDDQVNWYSKTGGLLTANSFSLHHTVTANDTIIAELTKSFGCTVTDTLVVTMSLPPAVDLGSDTGICMGEIFTVSVPNTVHDINWFDQLGNLLGTSFSYEVTINHRDTIIAEVSNVYQCSARDTIVVDVLALPSFSIGNDQEICVKDTALFEISGTWQSVGWSSTLHGTIDESSNTLKYKVLEDDTLIARVENMDGCINYDSAVVHMLPLPVISLGDDQSVCYEQNAVLQLSGGGNSIQWLDESSQVLATNTSSYSYPVIDEQTIRAVVTDGNNCISYDTIIVHVLPLPAFNIGSDTAICFHQRILLEAGSGFESVDWISQVHNSILAAETWFFDYEVTASDTLIAKVESQDGCVNYDSIKIDMLALPAFDLGEDLIVCYNDSVSLVVSGSWDEVNWYTENDLILQPDNAAYSYRVQNTMKLWAEAYDVHRCVNYDTINVNMHLLPEFDLGGEKAFCAGDDISLAVPDNASHYEWRDENDELISETNIYQTQAVSSKVISLTVTDDASCRFEDQINITVNNLPEFDIEGNREICENDTTLLLIHFADEKSISWTDIDLNSVLSDSDTLSMPFFDTKTVRVRLTDLNDCSNEKDIEIVVHARPVANAGEDLLLCHGESASLGIPAVDNNDYTWSPAVYLDDENSAQPITSPLETILYLLTVTNSQACISTDSVYIEVNPQINVEAGSNTAICIGESFTLGGNPTASGSQFPYVYQWFAGEEPLETGSGNPEVKPATSTRYYVLVTSGKCSVEIDSIDVTVNDLPSVSISDDQSIGAESSVVLNASGGEHYSWSPSETLSDATSASPTASPLKTTIYLVTVTDLNQCSDTASVRVIVQNNLFIPNVFSPNGDVHNDEFKLYGSGVDHIVLTIFDQKGNQVFRSADKLQIFGTGWDGTHNGKILKDDVYIWTIEGQFYNGDPITFDGKNNGVIKLMR